RQAGSNTVDIINAVKQILPDLQKTLPASLNLYVFFDHSGPIIEGVHDVLLTLVIAFILVVIVTYLSLGKLFNTIIPSIVLPLAIIGTFSIMLLLNFNLDILSLLAITLSIGFLVDDAIVVLENNVRHVQMGKPPLEAAMIGSKEITNTVISMTLCLVAVFIPMLFLGGVVGRLFKEFAITIVTAVAISGFISLSLTPLLCSRFIPPYGSEKKEKMELLSDHLNEKMLHFYQKCLTWVFHHKPFILLLGFLSIIGSVYLFTIAPKEFIPDEDRGLIRCYVESRNGTSPFLMKAYQEKVGKIIMEDKDVTSILNIISSPTDNEGVIYIRLKPLKIRDSQEAIIARLMEKLFVIPGISSYISSLPLINLQTISNAKALYQYTMSSIDQKAINIYTEKLEERLKSTPGFIQVSSDLQIKQPQASFTIDRDRASSLQLTANEIESLFSYAYSANQITTINGSINQYKVILETLPSYYKDPTVFQKLYIRSQMSNQLIPLQEVTNLSFQTGPLMLNHLNGIPSATVSFNLENISLGEAVQKLKTITDEVLPYSINGSLQGTANVFQSSFANLTLLFLLTFFVIYLVLGILYESFIHPLTVMSTLPPATFGALLTLVIFRQPISLYTFVGIIMLLGIVMKNGIMIVDFANDYIENEKKAPLDAIFHACSIRLRPIM
ncbi:MAG: efflux RND transporter permease subunit, partial [Chlamydiota bacterium]